MTVQEYIIQMITDETLFKLYIDDTALNVGGYDQLRNGLAITVSERTSWCKDTTLSNEESIHEYSLYFQ